MLSTLGEVELLSPLQMSEATWFLNSVLLHGLLKKSWKKVKRKGYESGCVVVTPAFCLLNIPPTALLSPHPQPRTLSAEEKRVVGT